MKWMYNGRLSTRVENSHNEQRQRSRRRRQILQRAVTVRTLNTLLNCIGYVIMDHLLARVEGQVSKMRGGIALILKLLNLYD